MQDSSDVRPHSGVHTELAGSPDCPVADLGDAQRRDIEVCDCGKHASTVGGGGKVFTRDGGRWVQEATPTGQNLKAIDRGHTPLAVGAGVTVIAKK